MRDILVNITGRAPIAGATHRRVHHAIPNPGATGRLRGLRVLLVEDNEVNQELALELLTGAGMVVDLAVNGREALERLDTATYDGVLMDCQMPVMDGYEATEALRRDPRFADLPVIAMTANAMAGDRERCLAAGMNDHLTKPIETTEMFGLLARWLRPEALDDPEPAAVPMAPVADAAWLGLLSRYDTRSGLVRTQGDVGLYRRLLRKFADGQRGFPQQFSSALAGRDAAAPTRLAHTLKGLAATLGAEALAGAAGALEQALRGGTAPDALLLPVFTELEVAVAEVDVALAEPDAAPPGAEPPGRDLTAAAESVAGQLGRLATLLQEGEAEATDVLDEILAAAPELGATLQAVGTAVRGYDFFAAYDELVKVAGALGISL
jgi:CheY-like chemotaxis protein